MTSTDETYNGWANHETWAAALHLSNSEWLYDLARNVVREQPSHFRAGEMLAAQIEEWAEELFHGSPDERPSGDVVMMLNEIGSRERVDWTAVAASFDEE